MSYQEAARQRQRAALREQAMRHVIDTDGSEVHASGLDVFRDLEREGYVTISRGRGPDRAFHRVRPVMVPKWEVDSDC